MLRVVYSYVAGCLVFNICRDSLFGIENTVQAGRFGIRIPAEAMIFFSSVKLPEWLWSQPTL